ncbi:hypothetical protein ZWY2020_003539 [Hordeum vulgare]|nr:hypothetical protein ZWY2020_003539 [Hordeum vulgare]
MRRRPSWTCPIALLPAEQSFSGEAPRRSPLFSRPPLSSTPLTSVISLPCRSGHGRPPSSPSALSTVGNGTPPPGTIRLRRCFHRIQEGPTGCARRRLLEFAGTRTTEPRAPNLRVDHIGQMSGSRVRSSYHSRRPNWSATPRKAQHASVCITEPAEPHSPR